MKALLSIKPKYADLILSGEKTIELRRVFNPKITKVYLYASSPVKRIVAVCDVRCLNIATGIIDRSCVSVGEYLTYLPNHYIEIKSVRPISATLSDIGLKRPPQNYQFLNAEQIKILEMK